MVAADVPPNLIEEDIVKDGRVVGMVEFGWSLEKVAFSKRNRE